MNELAHKQTIRRYERIYNEIKRQEENETMGGVLPDRKRPYEIERKDAEEKLRKLKGETQ